ncbi:DUF3888 domain-containing protein [Jeotgalibacillus proteolyticus]|uniref:DUF3888 domain-containing protein n=1 Tax=Jeotgalibacillus proteolyticus TaxID=2082395 RepID=UPI001431F8AD|nr:DUF3888 domain-containing protein [Jeotgalibacillus proteolyticus]
MKNISIAIVIAAIIIFTPFKANAYSQQDIHLRDDLILELLTPQITKELRDHFGTFMQYDCAQILNIKKIEQGSYLFTVDVQVVTFEGAHNPPYYVINMTLSNGGPGWN